MWKLHQSKMYLNYLQKPIQLPFYKHSGTFYLFFDQTSNLKYINDMNYIKSHDLMTKIYNRNFLEDIRNKLDDTQAKYHVILFDVDGLKLFNDILGHDQGDELLKRFARQLTAISKDDQVFPIRFGGDEFLILAIDKDEAYIKDLLHQLETMNQSLSFENQIHYSYAISASSAKLDLMKKVLEHADQHMYDMKQDKLDYKKTLKKELMKRINAKAKRQSS